MSPSTAGSCAGTPSGQGTSSSSWCPRPPRFRGSCSASPSSWGRGTGQAPPGTFVLVTAVLLLFAVGYSAMSRHIVNAGGFYTYVAHGLGRIPGLGAATLALFAYTAIQAGMFGALGAYVDRFVQRYLGAGLPWWLYSLAGTALCLALGVRKVEVGARALGVMLLLESALIIVLDVAIFATGGASEGGRRACRGSPSHRPPCSAARSASRWCSPTPRSSVSRPPSSTERRRAIPGGRCRRRPISLLSAWACSTRSRRGC
ncbi:hypothetical protein [Actinomadura madurae]|uniref:hypothetical protein n=1 Tax=Actinomadura madurae TaxID=1993 RepID=UPI0020D257FC|nr:hypothetical protein [Actinomadura madurae]MCQ0016496.1 hypothetical protein [Actinomadura madurae]